MLQSVISSYFPADGGTRSSSHDEANEREIVDDQSDGTVSCVDVGDSNLVNETASEVQVGYDNDDLQIDDAMNHKIRT